MWRARELDTRDHAQRLQGTGRGREYAWSTVLRASVDNITRMHLRMRASNWLWFCDNAKGFARICLIIIVVWANISCEDCNMHMCSH